MHNLKDVRKDYGLKELDEKTILRDPFRQFASWMDEALKAEIVDATAMVLSTVSPEGRPSSRVVLLKNYNHQGFDFFTNYQSHKAKDLEKNAYASLLFFWKELDRQVRIEGRIERISTEESDDYFFSRPVESQVGAWASPQSNIIPNRKTLKDWYEEFKEIFKGAPNKRPPHWGGLRLVPDLFEFWQGRENRLHDRIQFTKGPEDWVLQRLAP